MSFASLEANFERIGNIVKDMDEESIEKSVYK